ncbi:MAG: hypothetical protein IT371_02145 [Deltaproteobacteria bacterium]|nr:hypothetical protein [Deltaproteobacteria bacterium]
MTQNPPHRAATSAALGLALGLALAASGCRRTHPVSDAHQPVAETPPTWPTDLTRDLVEIDIRRTVAGEPEHRAVVRRRGQGLWIMQSPHRGEADPDAVDRLLQALAAPQLLSARPSDAPRAGTFAFEIHLTTAKGVRRRLSTWPAPLGQPIPVTVDGVGEFLVSPVELSTKIPDPGEFRPPGLWVSGHDQEASVTVRGTASYRLVRAGAEWKSADGRAAADLDDIPGVITARTSFGFPAPTNLKALGLDPPVAFATLCLKDGRCRDFRFGRTKTAAGERYFAVGSNADPIEMRDLEWRALVEGPFEKGRLTRGRPH